ncbi:MAG: alkaline phosphatase family protein [Myxococcota bacterium]
MRRALAAALAAALWACASLPGTPSAPPLAADLGVADGGGSPAQVVLVSVGGLTPDRYAPGGGMPALATLAAAGVAADGLDPVVPAAARAAHATLVSGVAPSEHGVIADRLLGERGLRRSEARHASLLRATTLWQRVAEAGGTVAALDWPTTLGAEIETLLPDVGPERQGETWRGLVARAATPWIGTRVAEADPAVDAPGAARDPLLVELACSALELGPRLVLLRLRGAEVALVAGGPRGAGVAAAFARVDRELARLVECTERAGRLADTAFVVVGDRALLATHTAFRPNVVLRAADLIGAQGRWKAIARSNGGSTFVYASDGRAALAARRLLEKTAGETRAFRVVSAEEMIQRQADPDAWFGLEAEPGFVFEDDHRGDALGPARARAAGGYLREDAAARTGFVAYGRGVRRGVEVPRMSQLDVAPTLAPLLGVTLERAVGRALIGLLRPERG